MAYVNGTMQGHYKLGSGGRRAASGRTRLGIGRRLRQRDVTVTTLIWHRSFKPAGHACMYNRALRHMYSNQVEVKVKKLACVHKLDPARPMRPKCSISRPKRALE